MSRTVIFQPVAHVLKTIASCGAHVMHQRAELYLQIRFAYVNLLIIPNH